MEIILSPRCKSITGTLSKKHGYYVRSTKKGRFFGQRSNSPNVPPDGHLRFIIDCAYLAKNGVYVDNIILHWAELYDALYEAGDFTAAERVKSNGQEGVKLIYNAEDIINLKITFGL